MGRIMFSTLQPYEVFSMLWGHAEQFQKALLGDYDASAVQVYWETMARSSWTTSDVLSDAELWENRAKVMPFFIHSDGGEIYKNGSYTIYQWCTPFAFNINPKDSRLYILMIDEAIRTEKTETEVASYLSYQNEVLKSGVHPSLDHDGNPVTGSKVDLIGKKLAGGWRAAFSAWTGDLKEDVKVHKLHRNYQCNFFCKKCLACKHKHNGNGYDFNIGAFWTRNLVNHATYLDTTAPERRSPYCQMKGWTIHRSREDDLHQIWLGFAKGPCDVFRIIWFFAQQCACNWRRGCEKGFPLRFNIGSGRLSSCMLSIGQGPKCEQGKGGPPGVFS